MASSVSKISRRSSPAAGKRSHRKPSPHRHCTLSRWGNSLGVRIPQEAAEQLKLRAGARVSVEVGKDSITIKPLRRTRKWSEADLLKGVTPEAAGGEVDWGAPRGREVW